MPGQRRKSSFTIGGKKTTPRTIAFPALKIDMAPSTLSIPSPPILEVLPTEILHIICAFLPIPDMGNFRLTCKDCANIGARHIVQEVHLMFTKRSFQNLINISQHDLLSKHVAAIFYEAQYLENVVEEDFQDMVLDNEYEMFDNLSMAGEGVMQEVQKAWLAYRPMLLEQIYMRALNYDMAVLAQTMARFPVLKKIEMCSEYSGHSEAMKRAFAATRAIPARMMDGGELSDDDEVGIRALGCLLLAAAAMPGRLEHLKAHTIHGSFFEAAPLNLWLPALTNLRHLDLVLECEYSLFRGPHPAKTRYSQLSSALRNAKHLETIRLFFDGYETYDTFPIPQTPTHSADWESLVGETHWPKLRSLELRVVGGNEDHWIRFIESHSKSLQTIKWHGMLLSQTDVGGWKRILGYMKDFLKLKHVVLGGKWEQVSASEFEGRPEVIKMEGATRERWTKYLLNRSPQRASRKKWTPKRVIRTRSMGKTR